MAGMVFFPSYAEMMNNPCVLITFFEPPLISNLGQNHGGRGRVCSFWMHRSYLQVFLGVPQIQGSIMPPSHANTNRVQHNLIKQGSTQTVQRPLIKLIGSQQMLLSSKHKQSSTKDAAFEAVAETNMHNSYSPSSSCRLLPVLLLLLLAAHTFNLRWLGLGRSHTTGLDSLVQFLP